ncbi:MAG: UbiA family prenyltransferase [Anaerolineaceae bacterium]|nr:UbiA family prenyltransferase [Anaerolineaceae bacterium]
MTIQQKSWAMIQMIRPELPAAAGVCVVVGQSLALGKFPAPAVVGLGFALGFFLSSSAMIFNDYFDLEVDRINAPQRPLPSGRLSQPEATAFGAITAGIALAIALLIHPLACVLSLVTWILGFLYNWKLKAAGLWGNLIVSASVAMTFIMGGVSVGQSANPLVWVFGLTAFVFDLAEEIAGDAMDMAGDQKRSSKSLAILYGKTSALRISGGVFGVMILLTFIPVILGETSLRYLIPITIMDGVIILFTYRLLKSISPQQGRAAMRGLYISASLGLIAFIISRFIG